MTIKRQITMFTIAVLFIIVNSLHAQQSAFDNLQRNFAKYFQNQSVFLIEPEDWQPRYLIPTNPRPVLNRYLFNRSDLSKDSLFGMQWYVSGYLSISDGSFLAKDYVTYPESVTTNQKLYDKLVKLLRNSTNVRLLKCPKEATYYINDTLASRADEIGCNYGQGTEYSEAYLITGYFAPELATLICYMRQYEGRTVLASIRIRQIPLNSLPPTLFRLLNKKSKSR